MNHKRKRPKNRRAGCLLCKPHKANGAKEVESASALRQRLRFSAEPSKAVMEENVDGWPDE